ncbi:MarR family transcriptional regulator [Streptomyces sp. IMTB 2501]|uniref:MarR family winged helix-turn-helix transcriptional regulator n=1 Tax=Streptomyces sp. IMTB 2501 TaxID=1776340 RepID=UPI00096CE733|nr:MarR family transcriptional regulator [Streptomyces sp. IMTB 2501]OLZ61284.1 MarR family transcriptional regulator [Streptomyces sp. IMTB 2501]
MKLPSDERLGHILKRAEQEVNAAKHTALRPFNLSTAQHTVMLAIHEAPGLSGAALARRCLVTPQTISSVLGTLEGRGLVERKPHPVHQHILEARLTRTGRNLLNKADDAVSVVEESLAAAFQAEERATFRAFLERCSSALRK